MPNRRKRRTHTGYKARLLAYKTEGRQFKNKEVKILKHIIQHPNDEQAQFVLKNCYGMARQKIVVDYTRKKPYTYWERFNLDEQTKRKSNGYGSNNARLRMSR